MLINRYNYEEYFLLYTDNELDEAERKAVERFIEENPDLKNELLGFQDAVIHADEEIKFPGKKELLSSNASLSIINNDNYTEYFLLYADNELNNEEKAQVEQYVYHNPELQEEFELMLMVKVEPDRSIVFENKELLMRHAEPTRVIAGWWKITASVAAALIFIIFGYLNYNSTNDDVTPGMISQGTGNSADSQKKSNPLIIIDNKVDTAVNETKARSGMNEPSEETGMQQHPADGREKPTVPNEIALVKKKTEEPKPLTVTIADGKIPYNLETAEEPREINVADLPERLQNTAAISVDHIQSLHQENLQLKAPVAIEAVELADARESDFSIAGIPVTSKSKVGNLISRTSRFINKTKKEISTRSSMVVGNFEIAIR